MSIQIEFEWEKDNLTETLLHLMAVQPKVWTQFFEDDQVPSIELFEKVLFEKLRKYFDRSTRIKEGSAVEPLLRPVWMSYVVSDKIAMDGHDQLFGGVRVLGHLGMLDSGYHSTRVITYESTERRMLGIKVVLLTRL